MRQEFASNDASLVRGYAWHVYADPATPGVMAGDDPFGADEPPGRERTPVEPPEGVGPYWLLNKNTPGIENHTEGHSYLVLTDGLDQPEVTAGWMVEAARLDESFQLDQRGGRTARLVRIIRTADSPFGKIQDCEFQVDRA